MDSLTHIALGACIGEAFAGKKLGRKAMLWGALAQSVPDIDFIAAFWMNPVNNLLAHRGFTHSILFALIITPVLAMTAERWHRPHNISYKKWSLFFGAQILTHLLIDVCNSYGVGWFIPFSSVRISFNILYVVDPFFSIWPGMAALALIILRKRNRHRKTIWRLGVLFCAAYMLYALVNKTLIDGSVRKRFEAQHIVHSRYFTTPTPLNTWLWFIVAENDSGFNIGYRSVFDRQEKISFQYFPRNKNLLTPIIDHEDVQHLIRFSNGYYSVEKWNDTLVFNDLRFGQIVGWKDPRERFVFHYFLEHPNDNTLVVQRGRFAKWDWDIAKSFIRRIEGN